jgi:GntR family transcriptional regulator
MDLLNRSSYKPLYLQLSETLRSMIENNDLKAGDRVPSENELAAQYAVSRNTARLAISALISQGLVYRIQGRGTFIIPQRLQFEIFELISYTEELRRMGMVPTSRVLRLERVIPPVKIACQLELAANQEAYVIERLRLADNEPMAINLSYISCDICPNLDQEDLAQGSLYDILERKFGIRLARAQQILRPASATAYESELLHLRAGYPLLLVEGVIWQENGRPIEWTRIIYRGDRYEFVLRPQRRESTE